MHMYKYYIIRIATCFLFYFSSVNSAMSIIITRLILPSSNDILCCQGTNNVKKIQIHTVNYAGFYDTVLLCFAFWYMFGNCGLAMLNKWQ